MTTLCLYTSGFPYGSGEQFIETEIKYLVKEFDRVVIIPANISGPRRELPDGVEILQPEYSGFTKLKGLLSIGWWVLYCLKDVWRHPNKILIISAILHRGYEAKIMDAFLKKHHLKHNTLHYTYWFTDQSTILAILKSRGKIEHFVSRAHGYDLYFERRKEGFIPFRKFQLKQVSRLFLISKNGVDYMKKKYPRFASKYRLSYMGTENSESPLLSPPPENNTYIVVSCSMVIKLKRIDLIVRALAEIKDIKIRWVHFGDGILSEDVKDLAQRLLPKNIKAEFKGLVPNDTVLKFFRDNYIDCFINVSSSEGLPVSIMEATSFGIPVLATDVGGTKEIVNSETGILMPASPDPHSVANNLRLILETKARNPEARLKTYNFWNSHFNAKNNYIAFCKSLKETNRPLGR
ncbi:glycosyltransferase [Thermophagus xiamenensis]|uniref:Glycosyltransferase involved in cell wall bisynthesis n=1 Tax=Thermophagus xiamenensis TaxID=385682 RepID=A0A1I2EUE7_9BACT|nr:glycosyltransferase [Thermophagus xiamenensis]SFE96068.1 Glycosyltransferase involved in cell wall bisynthesis [Thermophagus xiamenensis]